jgi:hypothetical protein
VEFSRVVRLILEDLGAIQEAVEVSHSPQQIPFQLRTQALMDGLDLS